MARLALLAGLFLVPAVLLWLGHRLRDRTQAQRGAFWGGVIGHSLALLLAVVGLHYPPEMWSGATRTAVVFWVLIVGGLAGALVGAARGRRS